MPNATEKADHAGMCYLCATPIYVGDEISRWTVNNTPVAAHESCLRNNMAAGSLPISGGASGEER